MKKKIWIYTKMILLLAGLSALFAFSEERHAKRKVNNIKVRFVGEENLYITEASVNKLLKQKWKEPSGVTEENIVLNKVENHLDQNPMISKSEVYLTVNGTLGINVKQRTPLVRIMSSSPYYLDTEGQPMPLSANYSARVPLVNHVAKKDLNDVFLMAKTIDKDSFLKKHITDIQKDNADRYAWRIRAFDFVIILGNAEHLDRKIKNFKAFYQKAKKDNMLDVYETINLMYTNQVVCIKKETNK